MVQPLPKMQSNPLAAIQAFTQPRRNQLAGLASGLLSSPDFGQGLGLGFARAAEGRQVDDAYAVSQREAADRQAKLEKTISYLRTQPGGSTWAEALGTGMIDDPKDAFKGWYEATKAVSSADETFYSPIKGYDKDGNPVFVQPGNRGGSTVMDLPEGFQPQQRFEKVDLGNEWLITDTTTGTTQRLPKQNFQEAFDTAAGTATGKATAEGQIGAPAAITSAETSIAQIDAVINDPNLKYAIGLGGLLPPIYGTPQAGTIARIEQLQGTAFLQAFESLKGGGQITEVEGKKATDAIARLSRAQNETDFKQALEDLKSVIQVGLERAKSKLPQTGGGAANQDVEDILKGLGL